MPSQHKNASISWHPADPALGGRIRALADLQERPAARVLDDAATEYLDRHEPATGEAAISELEQDR